VRRCACGGQTTVESGKDGVGIRGLNASGGDRKIKKAKGIGNGLELMGDRKG
jgi:hypothetical protein